MKHLKSYQIFESTLALNYLLHIYKIKFINALAKELENIDFDLIYSESSMFLQIDRPGVGTFITFNLDGDANLSRDVFSIENLRRECITRLESNKSEWKCSDTIKDDYDLLCTTILVFIDEWENK